MQFKLITEHNKYSQLILIIFHLVLLYIIKIRLKDYLKMYFIYGPHYIYFLSESKCFYRSQEDISVNKIWKRNIKGREVLKLQALLLWVQKQTEVAWEWKSPTKMGNLNCLYWARTGLPGAWKVAEDCYRQLNAGIASVNPPTWEGRLQLQNLSLSQATHWTSCVICETLQKPLEWETLNY